MDFGAPSSTALASTPPAAICLKNVSKQFGGQLVLRDISLELTSGDVVVIWGPSGSGKTTYGASRFLYAEQPKEGKALLDFNLAINPPCAMCPLPPKQNRLSVAIEAGELIYQSHAETAQTKPEK